LARTVIHLRENTEEYTKIFWRENREKHARDLMMIPKKEIGTRLN
jgi:hypothetical protein